MTDMGPNNDSTNAATIVTSRSQLPQDSVTETGICVLSGPEKADIKISAELVTQKNVNNKKADNSQTAGAADGHCDSDVQTNEHLDTRPPTISPHDVNTSSVVADMVSVLVSETNVSLENVLDDQEHKDGSQVTAADVSSECAKSGQGGVSESGCDLKSYCVAVTKRDVEVPCLPMSVNDNCITTVNGVRTSSPACTADISLLACEGPCQESCSDLCAQSETTIQHHSVKETDCCALPSQEKATSQMSSPKASSTLDNSHGSQNPRSLSSAELPKAVVEESSSVETLVNDDPGMLVVEGSGEICKSPSVTTVMPRSPLKQHLGAKTGSSALSSPEKTTIKLNGLTVVCGSQVNSEHANSSYDGVSRSDCTTATKPDESLCLPTPEASAFMVDIQGSRIQHPTDRKPTDTLSVTSESPLLQDSVMEIGGLSRPQKAITEIPVVNAQIAECAVEASALVVDAQNSPIQLPTIRSIACSPLQLPAVVAKGLQVVKTIECSVQTSPCIVDGSCSPLNHRVMCSTGCSAAEMETRSAVTSPIFLPAIGCSAQTEPWMISAKCSPMTPLCREDSYMADATTSLDQCSTKHDPDRLQSQTMPDRTSPGPLNSQLPACGEVGSETSYATALVMPHSDGDPQSVAVPRTQDSFKDSTQLYSCEELFGNNSSLPSSAAHQPFSTNPSQRSYLQASPHETESIINNIQPASSENNAFHTYSLESSQVSPKHAYEDDEEVKSNRTNSQDETDVQQQFA